MRAGASVGTNHGAGVGELVAALGPEGADLRPVLQYLDWAAALPNAAAPGFVYLAGALDGSAVGGGGATLLEAAGRLAGETAEALAAAPEPTAQGGRPQIDRLWTDDPAALRVVACDLADNTNVGVPVAAISGAGRRADAPPVSLGRAAGPDRDAALTSGILELVERDAAARWWLDGARPATLDPSLAPELPAEIARLRDGAPDARATSLLQLASPTGLPVIAALSRDGDGGLAVGLKAATTFARAARGAVLELMQMEIGLEMARHRDARGQATPGDRAALARAALDPDTLPALAACPARPAARPAVTTGAALVAALGRAGIGLVAADLPLPIPGLCVVKVFSPDLRPMPGGDARPRPGTPGALGPLM